jgi:D-3-phosphoglycerate dehydrogenase / 2-oxoglutarate reductase
MASRQRILVTPRSLTRGGDPALEDLARAGYAVVTSTPGETPGEEELLRLVPGCVGWLVGVEPVSESVIAAATALRAVSRNGTGFDNLPAAALEARGIPILRAAGANARGVAELTLALMLGSLRHVPLIDRRLKEGAWDRRRGREIHGRTVGLVGCGTIGRMVAEAVLALGARVAAYDPYAEGAPALGASFRWASLEAVLGESDLVSLHCPPPADGKALIDGAALGCFRPGAILINTARAALVDERAVLAALEDGRLGGFATDVFDPEPPPPSPLYAHARAIATPHVGGFTDESIARAARQAVDNLLEALAGMGVAPEGR